MNKFIKIREVRGKLLSGKVSIGSWMQIPNASVAEILGHSGYDWVAVDMEHGSITTNQLPDLFRALELGGTLPLVRLAEGTAKECKSALDAGASGVIIPMIETAEQLKSVRDACCWPPSGSRGVGFSRANLFGGRFDEYCQESQEPLIVAMIENIKALNELEDIVRVKGLDAIMIGPYDLSASLGKVGNFNDKDFARVKESIINIAKKNHMPCGLHIVEPSKKALSDKILEGYQFLAYSMDSVFMRDAFSHPLKGEIL